MEEDTRRCAKCGQAIDECFGFVKAGDIIDFLLGKRRLARELCGICANVWKWTKFGELARRKLSVATD